MSTLDAKESARYGVRLFGYLLATTLVAGAFVGLGIGVAYLLEPNVFTQLLPGGAAPDTTALVAGIAVAALGPLAFLTGLVVVLFTVLTDAVRVGLDRSADGVADGSVSDTETVSESTDSEQASDEAVEEGAVEDEADEDEAVDSAEPTTESVEREPGPGEQSVVSDRETTPISTETTGVAGDDNVVDGESTSGETQSVAADESPDPFASAAESGKEGSEEFDPTDPIDDPHSASSDPFGQDSESTDAAEWQGKPVETERERAGPAEDDDEAWRQEIEAKLEEQPEGDGDADGEER